MDGLVYRQDRIEMAKPYLSAQGIDYFGHAVFQHADAPLETHLHSGCMEIVYIMRGEQNYYTENHAYQLYGGQAFVSFFEQPHSSGVNFQGVSEIYWIQLNLTDQERFLGFSTEFSQHITDRLLAVDNHVFPFDNTCAASVKQCFQRFLREGASPEAIVLLMQLMVQTLDCIKNHRQPANPFSALEQYIETHLTENLSLDILSQVTGVSPSTISHQFKAHYGRTPGEFVMFQKISKAKTLLLQGTSVTGTAMALGFNTSDYFSTVFRKYTGKSPTNWLAEVKAEAK